MGDPFKMAANICITTGGAELALPNVFRLVFKSDDGHWMHCTAQYVGSKTRTLLTAAHCVVDLERNCEVYSDFLFIQRFEPPNGGDRKRIIISEIFFDKRFCDRNLSHKYDYAFINTVEPSSSGSIGIYGPHKYHTATSIGKGSVKITSRI